jgi:NADPH:quinone reductase-like Zn-dependent oxidoreductase
MRACQYERAGDASVLQLVDFERPTPRRYEALVAVWAASVNPVGLKHLELLVAQPFWGGG